MDKKWVIIIVVAVILICCCCAIVAGLWFGGDSLMKLFGSTPT